MVDAGFQLMVFNVKDFDKFALWSFRDWEREEAMSDVPIPIPVHIHKKAIGIRTPQFSNGETSANASWVPFWILQISTF